MPTPTGPQSPSKRASQANFPGVQTVRPAPDAAKISLTKAMGQAFVKLGNELSKGLEADPTEVAKAQAMIRQVQRASQGPPRPSPEDMGQPPRPTEADQPIDPTTGQRASQMVGPNTPRFT